jgi:predicted nucleic acid-binding protein
VRPIVVDASVLVAGLFKDGSVRDLLLNVEGMEFYAPRYVQEEALRQLPRIAARAHLPSATIEAVLSDLLGAIDLLPPGAYATHMNEARRLARAAGDEGDADYVALCLALECPIWALDRDFGRIPGIRVLSTRDLSTMQAGLPSDRPEV